MQKNIVCFFLCLILFAVAIAQKKSMASVTDQQQVSAMERNLLKALYAMDTIAYANILDETFMAVEPATVINKKQAIADAYASIKERRDYQIQTDSFQLHDILVRIYNNTAVSTFISKLFGKDNGQPFTREIHYENVWLKKNGKWKIVSSLSDRVPSNSIADEEIIKELIAERERGRMNGDKSVGNRIIHSTYTSINEIGGLSGRSESLDSPNDTAIIRRLAEQNKETQFRIHVDSFHVRFYNNVAIINYRLFYNLVFNKEPCEKIFQCNEVMMKTIGNWRSVSHSETVIPTKPYAVKTDTTRFESFTGQYQLFPTHIYNVVKENGKLYWGKVNKVELIPEDTNTFVPNGREFYRVRFETDTTGKVTSLRVIEYPGVEYSAIKIK